MSELAIDVKGLGKRYRIGEYHGGYATLRDRIAGSMSKAWRALRPGGAHAGNGKRSSSETIWALKDVSLEMRPGEVLGVIGPNGAGKSTLLKVLCRITTPTEGRARIRGRVGSLLEVGTGFHPELTGRENIYLNGAILGMTRTEIESKFDEMVSFAEVEKFIDTPVKHYSSGMYLRLAFAVAAHLEPEILLVDEVLAVGDAAFQKKCLDKMDDTAKGGRTIVFVSHNLSAVQRLCPRAVLLDKGRIVARGPSEEVVDRYLHAEASRAGERLWPEDVVADDCVFRPIAARIRDSTGTVTDQVSATEPFSIEIEYEFSEGTPDYRVGFYLFNGMGELLFVSFDRDDPGMYEKHLHREPGRFVSVCHMPANWLNQGPHIVGVSASSPGRGDQWFIDKYALRFVVDTTGGIGTQWTSCINRAGILRPALDWSIEPVR